MKPATYKIDENTERFSYTNFAVFRRWLLGWEKVFDANTVQECRNYVAEATKLPEYYAANGEKL